MKKTFEEWEMQKGLIAKDLSRFNSSKGITEQEFNSIVSDNFSEFVGVDYKLRVKFLKDNGYEVNRENLTADLSAKPVEG